ncbi:ArsR/SmtB family transcription factor [Actinomycetospora aeridis]|uniref:Metalloregulator ArsR/SmtB family transcription factor n=1 Tax=Actinomycetospora aeridis TaxID=3129231 RepID=A0ABU8N8D4_9PSEU
METSNENAAFDALSDRVRRRILAVLGEHGELSVNEIAAQVSSVGRTTVSTHLRVLRISGLVRERREGRNRLYSLDTEGAVRDAFVYLQTILHRAVDDIDVSTAEGATREGGRRTG